MFRKYLEIGNFWQTENQANMKKILAVVFAFIGYSLVAQDMPFTGSWELIREKSTVIDLFSTVRIDLSAVDKEIKLVRRWGSGAQSYTDSLEARINGSKESAVIDNRLFPTNAFMGIRSQVGGTRKVSAKYDKSQYALTFNETMPILVSQGKYEAENVHQIKYDPAWDILEYQVTRASRNGAPVMKLVFKRLGSRYAWFMNMSNNWEVTGGLNWQAALISLQGLANIGEPSLYFQYPEGWDYRFTPDVKKYLIDKHYYTFREIARPEDAFKQFRDKISGYVIWDPKVRTSMIVAFTIAGLEKSIVVDESLIPYMETLGIPKRYDLRNKFAGMNDAAIYQWAYDNFWQACSKDEIVWLGGESGKIMKPGIADWGVQQQAFFTDLSTKPSDTEEYALADKILSEMKEMGLVFGWHSYAKDLERQHVALCSKHGLRVEGLHTLPNLSFMSQVPASPHFAFKNHHNVQEKTRVSPGKKVYISCIQTDCLGLGAWNRPGRGSIPYAWEVTMNWSWLSPAMLEYFYTEATPNDYFIGSLGGPGYVYPKPVPTEKRAWLINESARLMKQLDLKVFEIMDYSEGSTLEGNTELPKEVVSQYVELMPDLLGLVNGYSPSFTFGKIKGVPILSYDYYLSPEKTEVEAVADLKELAVLNPERPYYLLMHVRQYSDISRVKGILDQLGSDFEVIPLDVMLKMASDKFTQEERFLEAPKKQKK
jgi:hypothetical protein